MTQSKSAEKGAQVSFPPPLIFLGSTLLGVVLRYGIALSPPPAYRYAIRWAGVAVLVVGLSFIVSARTLFARTGQNPKPWTPSPELLLNGPYRFTRNPMYLGVTLVQFGLGLAVSNLWISLLAPFSLLIVHFMAVLPEERCFRKKGTLPRSLGTATGPIWSRCGVIFRRGPVPSNITIKSSRE